MFFQLTYKIRDHNFTVVKLLISPLLTLLTLFQVLFGPVLTCLSGTEGEQTIKKLWCQTYGKT